MDLAAQQRELARRAVGVEASERSPAELPLDQVESFARSLLRKRAAEVRGLLPRTAAALGESFGARFQEYARGRATIGPHRHCDDALGFAHALLADTPPAIVDLARYEAAWIQLRLGKRLRLCSFRYTVDEPELTPTPTRSRIWVLWLRAPGSADVSVWRWPLRGNKGSGKRSDGAQERT